MRVRVIAVGIIIVVLFGSVIGMRWYTAKKQMSANALAAPLVFSATAQVEKRAGKLGLSGTIEAYRDTMVSTKISGRVQQILVEDGNYVQAGQALISLESRESENSVRMAQAAVAQSKANYNDSQTNLQRYQTLFDTGAVSEQQLTAARTKMMVDEAQHQFQLSSLANAQEQLAHATVTAPVSGYVANKSVVLGTVVNPGAPLMQVYDISNVYLTVSVQQKDIARFNSGQLAKVTADAYPGRVFNGVVEIINPAAGLNSRIFRVKIKLDNQDLALKPGMFAKSEIALGEPREIVTIPQSALVVKDGNSYVYVINGSTVRQTPVTVGEIFEKSVEVTGISAGTNVVSDGLHGIKDGDAVRLAN